MMLIDYPTAYDRIRSETPEEWDEIARDIELYAPYYKALRRRQRASERRSRKDKRIQTMHGILNMSIMAIKTMIYSAVGVLAFIWLVDGLAKII